MEDTSMLGASQSQHGEIYPTNSEIKFKHREAKLWFSATSTTVLLDDEDTISKETDQWPKYGILWCLWQHWKQNFWGCDSKSHPITWVGNGYYMHLQVLKRNVTDLEHRKMSVKIDIMRMHSEPFRKKPLSMNI